jgi:transmembrane sensor
MEKQELNALIKRHLDGNASDQDYLLLDSWYLSLHKDYPLEVNDADRIADLDEVKANLDRHIRKTQVKLWPRYAAAAAIVCVVGAAWLYFSPAKTITVSTSNQFSTVMLADLPPGSYKAILLLSDGKKVKLSDNRDGNLGSQQGTQLSTSSDGVLTYKPINSASDKSEFNQLQTPNGGNYRIILPDGTRVWLNAASTLKYPTSFSSLKERKVELSGEAYFEVSKNKLLPFRVMSRNQVIEVLGTHFNISCYPAEKVIKTTLLEGRIQINNRTMLKPGQQALFADNSIQVQEVDTETAVDWKNGKFSFNQGQDFATAMHQIERWYDVQFIYAGGKQPSMEPRGRLSKNDSLSVVLNGLGEMGKVNFRIEGRRVIVNN